jgi:hypothetical protein
MTSSSSSSDRLSTVRAAFDSWRIERKKKQKIPDHLWQMAVSLLKFYPLSDVARELGLNHSLLIRQQFAFKEQESLHRNSSEKTQFLELNQFLPNACGYADMVSSSLELQIERMDGTRLTLSLNSSHNDMIQNLVTAFIQA